jgi:hypothetical protein
MRVHDRGSKIGDQYLLISLAWPLAAPRVCPRGALGVAAMARYQTVWLIPSMRWLTLVNALRWTV